MPDWKDLLRANPLPWLLERDTEQPGVRYFALRDLLDMPENDGELQEARTAIMKVGPVPAILAGQAPGGYWVKPDDVYGPKYKSTLWQIIFLAQLGADGTDPRVRAGCMHVQEMTVGKHGGYCVLGRSAYFLHCMAGNLAAALIDLGLASDERVRRSLEWQARTIIGQDVAGPESRYNPERYYNSGTCGPMFACAANQKQPCAWGAVKAMLALGKFPKSDRTPAMNRAIAAGIDFLLGTDPAVADYPHPMAKKPSESWFKFGYPIGYVTDVLQVLEALALLGMAADPRLTNALKLVSDKQDGQGRWKLEYTYNGKTWTDIEEKGRSSKWVTLRALRALKAAYPG